MTAGHFKTGNEAHIIFLLDSSALEPTSDRQRLDTMRNHGASRKACSATCSGGLWFVETDRRPCEQERRRESQLKGDLTTTAWSKKSRECPTLWGGKLGYNSSLPTYNKSLSIPAAARRRRAAADTSNSSGIYTTPTARRFLPRPHSQGDPPRLPFLPPTL